MADVIYGSRKMLIDQVPDNCRGCNSKPDVLQKRMPSGRVFYYVKCLKCGIHTQFRTSTERAIEAWNTITNPWKF